MLTATQTVKTQTQETIEVFARAGKPVLDSDLPGEVEIENLHLFVFNNARPIKPQIQLLIQAQLGEEWQLLDWSVPEPLEEWEFAEF